MLARYVFADLFRNPRRTLSTMVGVMLGVGLFCGVLFFVDGLSASMTQRAVAPLAIDMQRIVGERVGGSVGVTQRFDPAGSLVVGDRALVTLEVTNSGEVAANEVTVRSLPGPDFVMVPGSAKLDGRAIPGSDENPLARGPGQTGLNLGTIPPATSRTLSFEVEVVAAATEVSAAGVSTTVSTREDVEPERANRPRSASLAALAAQIAAIDGVASAYPLSLADLGPATLAVAGCGRDPVGLVTSFPAGSSAGGRPGHTSPPTACVAAGATKVFGFDADYAAADDTIVVVEGALAHDGAMLSAEAAGALDLATGDVVSISLPDGSAVDLPVSGVADLSRSRSLFSSRRGGDLETFVYTPNSVIVSSAMFADVVYPAFERAATSRGDRLKNPPIREVDVSLVEALLDADPATAVAQTEQIAEQVRTVGADGDYVLDNISNTLTVATADARVAKRLFAFLGVPGGALAAMLAAFAGSVLADAQRREQATLRVRGADRRHLLRMLAVRTAVLTAFGAVTGLMIGYSVTGFVLGEESLGRASTSSLVASAVSGTSGGFVATGLALYVTGRRSIDREIDEDRARLALRPPLWRRAWIDVIGAFVVVVGTAIALVSGGFEGSAGSVYFGRSVQLNLALLVLPVAVWITGSLLAARIVGSVLTRTAPASTPAVGRPLVGLYRRSVGRRPWAIGNGVIVVALIVALATSLGAFTSSYDAAKVVDARYANGADIRITPSPSSDRAYTVGDAAVFRVEGVGAATPVIYGLSNVILRSARTSDPANLVAIDPVGYAEVAPGAEGLTAIGSDPTAVLVSRDMADFLQVAPGDTVNVLLARATDAQVEVALHVVGLFDRLAGFPDGADVVMSIQRFASFVPSKPPDFFLAAAADRSDAGLDRAVTALVTGPGSADPFQIDTRATTLARDQSSLAALNIAGLVDLDSSFSLAMSAATVAIFVFGLLLQRRREYVILRAQGLEPRAIRVLIVSEAATMAVLGSLAGVAVGVGMGFYFVTVLRPLFVVDPTYTVSLGTAALPVALVIMATLMSSVVASRLVGRLEPTELLRDD